MILIRDILVSRDVVEEQFLCNLKACKGACCWEGDWGAPLEMEERHTLEHIYDAVRPFLSDSGITAIEEQGLYSYYEEAGEYGTSLQPGGACVFMTYDHLGIARCGIEQAYLAGATSFKKPLSCHLYPIRVKKNEKTGFEALNYDRWDICSAACELGKKESLPVYRFLRDAIVRKYGEEFYEQLDEAAKYMVQEGKDSGKASQ